MGTHDANRLAFPHAGEGVLMRALRRWTARLRFLFNRRDQEQDFADEIQANVALHIDDNIRSGMSPDDARRAALIKFGSIDSAKEAVREARSISFLETLLCDIHCAL